MSDAWSASADVGVVDLKDYVSMVVKRRHSLLPCKRPTALAVDGEQRLYSACRNGLLMVTAPDGQVMGRAKIGRGSDGVILLDGLAYSADGADGTLSIVSRQGHGRWASYPRSRQALLTEWRALEGIAPQ